jgi:hypothetical protein
MRGEGITVVALSANWPEALEPLPIFPLPQILSITANRAIFAKPRDGHWRSLHARYRYGQLCR